MAAKHFPLFNPPAIFTEKSEGKWLAAMGRKKPMISGGDGNISAVIWDYDLNGEQSTSPPPSPSI
jgi:hypothetical protein